MDAIPPCERPFAAVKKSLRDEFPYAKSAHIAESMAHGNGFRTNATLNAASVGSEQDR